MIKIFKEKMGKKIGNDKKGFTLAELLIVVAIIGVLVAISIPIFTSQLEKSREATDAANLRSAYAEVMAAGLGEDTAHYSMDVATKQGDKTGWVDDKAPEIGGITAPAPGANGWTVTYDPDDQTVSIDAKS